MTHNQIKGALIAQNSNFKRLAGELNKTPVAVQLVSSRKIKSRYVAEAIANKIKKPLWVIFPEYPEYRDVK